MDLDCAGGCSGGAGEVRGNHGWAGDSAGAANVAMAAGQGGGSGSSVIGVGGWNVVGGTAPTPLAGGGSFDGTAGAVLTGGTEEPPSTGGASPALGGTGGISVSFMGGASGAGETAGTVGAVTSGHGGEGGGVAGASGTAGFVGAAGGGAPGSGGDSGAAGTAGVEHGGASSQGGSAGLCAGGASGSAEGASGSSGQAGSAGQAGAPGELFTFMLETNGYVGMVEYYNWEPYVSEVLDECFSGWCEAELPPGVYVGVIVLGPGMTWEPWPRALPAGCEAFVHDDTPTVWCEVYMDSEPKVLSLWWEKKPDGF